VPEVYENANATAKRHAIRDAIKANHGDDAFTAVVRKFPDESNITAAITSIEAEGIADPAEIAAEMVKCSGHRKKPEIVTQCGTGNGESKKLEIVTQDLQTLRTYRDSQDSQRPPTYAEPGVPSPRLVSGEGGEEPQSEVRKFHKERSAWFAEFVSKPFGEFIARAYDFTQQETDNSEAASYETEQGDR